MTRSNQVIHWHEHDTGYKELDSLFVGADTLKHTVDTIRNKLKNASIRFRESVSISDTETISLSLIIHQMVLHVGAVCDGPFEITTSETAPFIEFSNLNDVGLVEKWRELVTIYGECIEEVKEINGKVGELLNSCSVYREIISNLMETHDLGPQETVRMIKTCRANSNQVYGTVSELNTIKEQLLEMKQSFEFIHSKYSNPEQLEVVKATIQEIKARGTPTQQ